MKVKVNVFDSSIIQGLYEEAMTKRYVETSVTMCLVMELVLFTLTQLFAGVNITMDTS